MTTLRKKFRFDIKGDSGTENAGCPDAVTENVVFSDAGKHGFLNAFEFKKSLP